MDFNHLTFFFNCALYSSVCLSVVKDIFLISPAFEKLIYLFSFGLVVDRIDRSGVLLIADFVRFLLFIKDSQGLYFYIKR